MIALSRRPATATSTRHSTSGGSTVATWFTLRQEVEAISAHVHKVGRRLPAYTTALGKALLADRFGTERDEHIPDVLTSLTPHTITIGTNSTTCSRRSGSAAATDDQENTVG